MEIRSFDENVYMDELGSAAREMTTEQFISALKATSPEGITSLGQALADVEPDCESGCVLQRFMAGFFYANDIAYDTVNAGKCVDNEEFKRNVIAIISQF